MERSTYVLVDGENIDATLGTSILSRRPHPTERPRWERLLKHLPGHAPGHALLGRREHRHIL